LSLTPSLSRRGEGKGEGNFKYLLVDFRFFITLIGSYENIENERRGIRGLWT
jgi:hypothetical protein